MKQLEGSIFSFRRGCIAYKNNIESDRSLILIGGLGDNILSLPYVFLLNKYCEEKRIRLVIPQLRSMPNFEINRIENDVEDLDLLINSIDGRIALLGHSTGCNDILLYLKKGFPERIHCAILQGPVSDPESMEREEIEEILKRIDESDSKYKFFEIDGRSWLKERFVSLYSIRGKEDLFSSYLEDSHFSYWKNKLPILSILSGNDEYCHKQIPDKFKHAGDVHIIEDADHSISSEKSQDEFLKVVNQFLEKINYF